MTAFYNNIAVFEVAIAVCAYSWIFGGTMGPMLVPVMPWLALLMLEALLCFPQKHSMETTFEARTRVWSRLKKDPLTWTVLAFFLYLALPFLNKGLCEVCDYPLIASGANPRPPAPFLPFCVNRMDQLGIVMWFVPTLIAVLTVKHALLKTGKRLLLQIIVWNGFLLAILGAVQSATGAKGPLWTDLGPGGDYFFSTFGYPNMAGDFFTTIFALGFGLWRRQLDDIEALLKEEGRDKLKQSHTFFWKKHYLLIPTGVAYFAAINTLSRASIMLVTLIALVMFVHTATCMLKKMSRARRFKAGVIGAFGLALIVLFGIFAMPEDIQREVDTINTGEVLNRMTGKGQYHVRVATAIWRKHPLFGVGGWGYRHFCIPEMSDKELQCLQTLGGINVHNDHLQVLVEHGIVGMGFLVAIVVMLLLPVTRQWGDLLKAARFLQPKQRPPMPLQVFVLPAPVFAIMLASIATLVHGFGDCPLRSPAILSVFFVSLAAMRGFMPTTRQA